MVVAEALSTGAQRARRVVFYSHDTVGLGHIRRNIALAAALVRTDVQTDVLLITGNPEAAALPRPANTDIVTLPTVVKDATGRYRSHSLLSALHHVLDRRAAVIQSAVRSFRPDLLVVDKVPLGVGRELLATLKMLRDDPQRRTSVVLGLREILDDPVSAVREWTRSQSTRVIEDYYDAVWVYGDRRVYDPDRRVRPAVPGGEQGVYTGYLADDRDAGLLVPTADPLARSPLPPQQPYLLCMVGGGQDGFELSETFVRTALPAGYLGVASADRSCLPTSAGGSMPPPPHGGHDRARLRTRRGLSRRRGRGGLDGGLQQCLRGRRLRSPGAARAPDLAAAGAADPRRTPR